jgi:predicted N-acetyltransferase YhbS
MKARFLQALLLIAMLTVRLSAQQNGIGQSMIEQTKAKAEQGDVVAQCDSN